MELFLMQLFNGISVSSILLLAALGLAITFGLMGVINMAHGEFIMIGAYTAYVVQNIFQAYFPSQVFDVYCGNYPFVSGGCVFGLCAGAAGDLQVVREGGRQPSGHLGNQSDLTAGGQEYLRLPQCRGKGSCIFGENHPDIRDGGASHEENFHLADCRVLPYRSLCADV